MSDLQARKTRLAAARYRWAWEYRQRGYTTYRNGRPHYRPSKAARRGNEQLKESLLMVGVVILGWLWLVAA